MRKGHWEVLLVWVSPEAGFEDNLLVGEVGKDTEKGKQSGKDLIKPEPVQGTEA